MAIAPLLTRRRVLAAKAENTPGTAVALAIADAAMNVFDAVIKPDITMQQRAGQSSLSPLPSVAGAQGGTATFAVELAGSGSAGSPVPLWASVFLPACGFRLATNVFYRDSRPLEASGTGQRAVTIGLYQGGRLKRLRGAMGNAVLTFPAGQIVKVEFTFKGIYDEPSGATMLAPTYPTVLPPVFAGATMTIGGVAPRLRQWTLDMGNEVILRPGHGDGSGYYSALITAWRSTGKIDPEAKLVADDNPHYRWINAQEQELAAIIGAGSANGNKITIGAPKFQITNLQEADRDGVATDEIDYQLNRSDAAGEDDLTITFD